MSDKVRTSISINRLSLEEGRERAAKLGYDSFSEYVEFLVNMDVSAGRRHVVIRDGETVRYQQTDGNQ